MKKRAFLFVIIAGLFWGTTGIFSSLLGNYGLTGMETTFVRGLVSVVFVLLYALIFQRKAFRISLFELVMFFFVGIALFGASASYFFAIPRTSVSTAVILMYTAPVMVSIVSLLFLGEKFSPLKIVAVAVMLLGCLFVSGVIGGFKMDGLGIFLGILSGVFYASYNILTKILMRRGTSPMSATLYGFIFMVFFASFFVKPELIFTAVKSSPLESVPLMLLIGPMTFVLPYVLYTIAMKTLPAGTASALSTVEPMAATVFSMIIFGEIPTLLSGTGILLVLLAVFLLGRAQNNESEES